MKFEDMDEHLVGYTLGCLDPVTKARVDAQLRTSPETRLNLDLIEQALAPLAADGDDIDLPEGLARRTLARIDEHHRMLPSAPVPQRQSGPINRRRFRWPDGLVAALLFVLVGGLFFPALARQWQAYQRLSCANTLRQIHAGLSVYAEENGGAFPRVESTGPRAVAGIFVPVLTDSGALRGVHVSCPSTGKGAPPTTVAALEHLHRTNRERFQEAARILTGGYAYSLGYVDGGRINGLRMDSGDDLPLIADAAFDGIKSQNHGGAGQNVLHVGGHVRWCTHAEVGIDGDNIYFNQQRQVHAGLSRQDSVLAAGDARACPID